MTFTHLLHGLIALTGTTAFVVAMTRTTSMGVEVLGAEPGDPEETPYFTLGRKTNMLNELALDDAVLRLNDRLGDLVGVSIEGSDGRTIAKIVGFLSSFAQHMLETDDPLTERLIGPDIGPWYMVVPRPPAGDPLHEFLFTLSPDVVRSVEESEPADYPEDGGGMEFGLRDGVRIALRPRP